ncbi:MAG: hypothetical protein ACM3O7_06625 [Acidobacteriota bacterium]
MKQETPPRIASLLCAVLSIAAGGCASVFNGTHQHVRIVTVPPGARAEAMGQSTITPGELRVPRTVQQVTVHIEKDGFKPVDAALHRERSGAVWANWALIPAGMALGYSLAGHGGWFGGLEESLWGGVGIPVAGMVTDFATGSAYRFEEELIVGLEAKTAEERAPTGELDRGSPRLKTGKTP